MRRWWRSLLLLSVLAWGLLLVLRCHLPRQTVSPDSDRDSMSAVYLVRHGWHAGVVLRRADIPADRWPVLSAFSDAEYLEVGWGEAHYYPGQARGAWSVVRAGLWPTGSVLHVVPISGSVQARFRDNTIVRIPVGPNELDALTTYISASFARTEEGDAIPAAPGYYPDSRFYRSPLSYHVFNNSNHWTAGALEAAGCDISPRWIFTAGQVVRQARECGTLLQRRAEV